MVKSWPGEACVCMYVLQDEGNIQLEKASWSPTGVDQLVGVLSHELKGLMVLIHSEGTYLGRRLVPGWGRCGGQPNGGSLSLMLLSLPSSLSLSGINKYKIIIKGY